MGVEWSGSPAEPHAAKLVREGNSLNCERCGAHVMTFLDPPPADVDAGRQALAEALAEPLAETPAEAPPAADPFGQTLIGDTSWIPPRTPADEETSGLDGLGVSPDWNTP